MHAYNPSGGGACTRAPPRLSSVSVTLAGVSALPDLAAANALAEGNRLVSHLSAAHVHDAANRLLGVKPIRVQ